MEYYVQQYPVLMREIGKVIFGFASPGKPSIVSWGFDAVDTRMKFAKGLRLVDGDLMDRFKLILINDENHQLLLQGTFKVVFPHGDVVKILLDFEETDRFHNIVERLRCLMWQGAKRLENLVDFFDRGNFPILMIAENI